MTEIRWTPMQADNIRLAIDVMTRYLKGDVVAAEKRLGELLQEEHGADRLVGGFVSLTNLILKDNQTRHGVDRMQYLHDALEMVNRIPLKEAGEE